MLFDITFQAKHHFAANLRKSVFFCEALLQIIDHMHSIFSKMQQAANQMNIGQLQISKEDEMFKLCTLENFKILVNKELKNLKISIVEMPKTISDDAEKMQILKFMHDDPLYGGHIGQRKLYEKIRARFFWKNMTKDIAAFVRSCQKC